jgi:hypothetical protein
MTAVKTLFTYSRNICFFTGCEEQLTDPKWKMVNAEVAHINGENPGSARCRASAGSSSKKSCCLLSRLEDKAPIEYPADSAISSTDAPARPFPAKVRGAASSSRS